jgi:2OG-Fe(II) oxygenase superfamily
MSGSSFWRSGVEMIPAFLSPTDCSGLLSAVDSYCEIHTVPLIVRPQRHRSLEYQVIDGEHFHSVFANATDLLSQVRARVQQLCGCELTFIDDSRAACNVNITPPGGQYIWHYDRNLVTAVIYLNEVSGGETELYPNRRVLFPGSSLAALQPVVDKLILSVTARTRIRGPMTVTPTTGAMLVLRGNRTPHSVRPVLGGQRRVTMVLAFDQPDARNTRPALDEFLYTNGPDQAK